jgi:rod shape-determining protein MreC
MQRGFRKFFRKNKDFFLLILIILLTLVIFLAHLNNKKYSGILSGPIYTSIFFIYKIVDYPVELSSNIFSNYIDLVSVKKDNKILLKQNNILKDKLYKLNIFKIENGQLRKLLNLKKNVISKKTISAVITIHGIQSWFRSFYINKGQNSGINVGEGIVSDSGVIGRIIETGRYSSKAIVITNPKCAFSVVDAKTGVVGIAKGIGNGYLKIKFVFSTQKANIGDKILTSGLGGVFTAGLSVGHIIKVTSKHYDIFKKIIVEPHKNLFNSKNVLIER